MISVPNKNKNGWRGLSEREKRLYRIWSGMKHRCNNPNNPKYNSYGGKGIKVCKEWESDFSAFCKWSYENGYKNPPENCDKTYLYNSSLTIDRIDSGKDYCPENCRWVTFRQNRTRNNVDSLFIFNEEGCNVREKESYRDNLERIIEAFPGQEVIKTKQLAKWLKMDPRTVEKRFPVKPGIGISVATLARWMS